VTLGSAPDDFLSGTSGHVVGIRRQTSAVLIDAVADATAAASLMNARVRRAALGWPRRQVLVLAIEREGMPNLLAAARAELERSRHDVRFYASGAGDRGKFENINALLAEHPAGGADWLLVVDDDVALPRGFLDTFVLLAERFAFRLAQPAHRARSHAAWQVTRRHVLSLARETMLVEIGPVVAFHSSTFETLLPFPALRTGWGLDLHWSAVARANSWRMGVVDATPILHGMRRIASAYDRDAAIAEAREFLAARPYTNAAEAQRTVARYRSL
jgi:hypothetical protein